ncbi:MAG TPA: PDZ domain-containing protein [Gemmatimonadales bacterium]|nr:PDZ domain-containing protein [Gemmatimonadales bacterium]
MRRVGVCAALATAILSFSAAQVLPQASGGQLPRRAALGVTLAVDAAGAVVVSAVPPGSAGALAGVAPGDAIAALDGTPVTSIVQVQALIGGHRGGDSLVIDIVRSGEKKRLVAVLRSFAHESLPNTTFDYSHVTLPDGIRLRTIVSRPMNTERPSPAVLFLQGGGCSSIDVPWAVGSPGPLELIHAIASRGFVTMRVDKPGAGDSEGPPCAETGFREELAGYQTALRALLADPAVDKNRVFLVGLSLGGFFAPLLARDVPVMGISAYGTIAFTPTAYPGRSERFFREIAVVDILAAWAAVDTRVQLLHGTYDAVSTASDHAKIAAIVNGVHPGRAEHREFEGLDHCWTRQKTPEAGRDNCGGGEATTSVTDAVLEFIGRP